MLLSVGGDYVAGRKYKVKPDEADRLIALGVQPHRGAMRYEGFALAPARDLGARKRSERNDDAIALDAGKWVHLDTQMQRLSGFLGERRRQSAFDPA
jgi:hypothetical protein